ncbi:YciI family protein [Fodinicurvata fenggangensis]|uniref:YciI family protein n=1 Tax=Fodinicurvata fenggangensis TaxID=1121830 RepID=UPI000479513F|nr:YciI family protein [Fodinicurvata fenggangensis]
MLFALICHDKANGLALRKEKRPAHLSYLEGHGDQLVYAGPLMGEDGQTPAGSLIVLDVPDRNAAESFAAGDPYARAGLFENVEIRATKRVFPHN